ncbi:hypothetical protein HYH02_015342 [Chlamydomonas schloesseri]|uniref:Protein kinase domain-containing protein n=1 Tax=Chlamydomonas schloesseri TaxID=2026947 RepID=A0A835VPW9_9CHLO|nr:hypothetical protein HYH02_015342 [Chlamydomonas schloesseri]|eukprot:KAG2423370.1 hypothetical protein HYH02_015342 [Chlamydomonas schloesseri]
MTVNSRGSESAALEEVALAVKKVETAIRVVERDIAKKENALNKLEEDLSAIDARLTSPTLKKAVKAALQNQQAHLRNKETQLREEIIQLRNKEAQLRNKEAQLRNEKARLLDKEARLLDAAALTRPDTYLRRALRTDAPSQTSLKREQLDVGMGPLINNWRPTAEAAGLLPELIHPIFGEVRDLLDSDTAVDQATIDVARQLCSVGARVYDSEAQLTSACRGLLQPYLATEDAVTIKSGFARNKVSPDWALGDSAKDPSNVFLIFEAKPGIGGTGDPNFQGANYHLHFFRRRVDSAIFQTTFCPTFLLEVVGPQVRLSAVAWLDRVTIFPLTPLLNLLPAHPITDVLLMPVARMLAALRLGVRKLAAAHAEHRKAEKARAAEAGAVKGADGEEAEAEDADADDAQQDAAEAESATLLQYAITREVKPLPWPISAKRRYDPATAQQLAPQNPTYYVHLAAGSRSGTSSGFDSGGSSARPSSSGSSGGAGSGGDGSENAVVVKLCRKYGVPAHQAWAGLGLAPQINFVEQLPGGWILIEMEWLPEPEWRQLSDLQQGAELEEALAAVREALECAHTETGMVHGDVRPPNCMVRRSSSNGWEVRFVDFEWAGDAGQATYPACLNPDIPWPDGVAYGTQLQREHDIKLLAATTARTRSVGRKARGPGAVMSLHTVARDGSAGPVGKAGGVMLHRGTVGVTYWRPRVASGWSRLATPGPRLFAW